MSLSAAHMEERVLAADKSALILTSSPAQYSPFVSRFSAHQTLAQLAYSIADLGESDMSLADTPHKR